MTRNHSDWNRSGASQPRGDGSPATALRATFMPLTGPARAAILLGNALGRAIETLLLWQARTRARRDLASFNDQMLHDIGVSRADVDHEFSKPFWRG